jgi:hypothetical protein
MSSRMTYEHFCHIVVTKYQTMLFYKYKLSSIDVKNDYHLIRQIKSPIL